MTRAQLVEALKKGEKIFRKQDFSNENLAGLDLSGCDFRRSNFTNCNFAGANLTNAIMVVCTISNAKFSGANITGVDWELVVGADTAKFVGAVYDGTPLKSDATVDKVGKYQRLFTDGFMQIGCLKGDTAYWDSMDDAKLNVEVDKVNPPEKADAKAWKDAHLAQAISDHKNKKPL